MISCARINHDPYKATIVAKNADPCCLKLGYTSNLIQAEIKPLSVVLGPSRINATTIIKDEDDTLMGLSPAEQPGSPMRLDACLRGKDGLDLLSIVKNEWRVGTRHYDVTVKGNRLEVRRALGEIVLSMNILSDKEVQIRRLHMFHKGYEITCNEESLSFKKPGGGKVILNAKAITADVALWFRGGSLQIAANHQGQR